MPARARLMKVLICLLVMFCFFKVSFLIRLAVFQASGSADT
jgi:hypothetical protein